MKKEKINELYLTNMDNHLFYEEIKLRRHREYFRGEMSGPKYRPEVDFSCIPKEILAHILCFLDHKSFVKSNLVCKRWFSAAKMVQPEVDLRLFIKRMQNYFGDDWFKKHLIGNLPNTWESYPFFPIHFKLAFDIISRCTENTYMLYPASWKGKELTALGLVWRDSSNRVRDAVMQRTNYWNEHGRMKGIAACCRSFQRKKSFGHFQHWHQSHGRLSMEDHLEQIQNCTPLDIYKIFSMLDNKSKLSVLHTWYEIESGIGPDIPI